MTILTQSHTPVRNAAVAQPLRDVLAAISPHVPPLQRFIVEHVKPGSSRTPFEVMAPSRQAAITANEGACAEGEYLIAWTPAEWADKIDGGEPDADLLEYSGPRHVMRRESTGHGLGDSTTPVCACGWRGRPVPEYSNIMASELAAQERAHLGDSATVGVKGRAA